MLCKDLDMHVQGNKVVNTVISFYFYIFIYLIFLINNKFMLVIFKANSNIIVFLNIHTLLCGGEETQYGF